MRRPSAKLNALFSQQLAFLASPLLASLALQEAASRFSAERDQLIRVWCLVCDSHLMGLWCQVSLTWIPKTLQERSNLPASEQALATSLAEATSEKITLQVQQCLDVAHLITSLSSSLVAASGPRKGSDSRSKQNPREIAIS